MAVPKRKQSKARRDKRRSNVWKLEAPTLVKCPQCASPFFLFIPIFYSAGKELPPCRYILSVLMNIPPHSVWA